MSDSYGAQGSAIYARLGTAQYPYYNGTALTSGTMGVYDTLAPQNPSTMPPYLIYQFMDSVDSYTFTSHSEATEIVVKAVSYRTYPAQEAQPIYAKAHELLQDAPLSISGDTLLRLRRRSRIRYRDPDGYWHVGGLYGVEIRD